VGGHEPTQPAPLSKINGGATAARLGLSGSIVPPKYLEFDANIKLVRVNTVREAMKAFGLTGKVLKRTDDF
jgi:hypothetical protein